MTPAPWTTSPHPHSPARAAAMPGRPCWGWDAGHRPCADADATQSGHRKAENSAKLTGSRCGGEGHFCSPKSRVVGCGDLASLPGSGRAPRWCLPGDDWSPLTQRWGTWTFSLHCVWSAAVQVPAAASCRCWGLSPSVPVHPGSLCQGTGQRPGIQARLRGLLDCQGAPLSLFSGYSGSPSPRRDARHTRSVLRGGHGYIHLEVLSLAAGHRCWEQSRGGDGGSGWPGGSCHNQQVLAARR